MCGFCGILGPARAAQIGAIDVMTRTLAHRGPDDSGTHAEHFAARGAEYALALGHTFRSDCDTEVLTEAYRAWGVVASDKLVGMFAFALFDRAQQRVLLVRDRLGIEPLHYYFADGLLSFGSELRALRAQPAFRAEVDRGALGRYLRGGYTIGEQTIYRDKRRPDAVATTRLWFLLCFERWFARVHRGERDS